VLVSIPVTWWGHQDAKCFVAFAPLPVTSQIMKVAAPEFRLQPASPAGR
jgi:hypothetical protein